MGSCPRLALCVAIAGVVTGCGVGGTITPPDDDGGGGLSIVWIGRPDMIASEPSSDITIERAVFRQDDLRVVGDAGTFGLDRDVLEWSRGIVPAELPVTGALPGLYARFLFALDGDDDLDPKVYSYEITGTAKV